MNEMIWWCEVRRAEDPAAYRRTVVCHVNANGSHSNCGERRLVSPDAVVLEQDQNEGVVTDDPSR